MLYFYIVTAVALVPVLDNFFPILKESYSWWLTPVLAFSIFLSFLILHAAFLAICIQSVNLKKPPDPGSRFLRRYITLTIPIFYKLARVHVHVSGAEKIPDDKRVMLVCNHRDIADPVFLLSELSELELGFIAKKEVYEKIRFVAKALHKMHGLAIDRENNREAAKTIINAVKILKEDKASIAVFPEGYTNRTNQELLPLRSGVFKIAERGNVPIVVCTLYNSPTVLKNMFRKRSDVYLNVAAVLEREELHGLHTDAVAQRVTEIMTASLNETKRRISEGKN
ncbi:MAG: 1-acyl-sn-glycerol-3-phosphate acyltransferase [Clostridia bacterium]|nr:1-acyl-sn-glycerol-3-phosphate acyltransferase [Clostridia bacterium]